MDKQTAWDIHGELSLIVDNIPPQLAVQIAGVLEDAPEKDAWNSILQNFQEIALQSHLRQQLIRFVTEWKENASSVSPLSIAFAIKTASRLSEKSRGEESIQLVWTGPTSHRTPMRRTDQALLQLIESAQETLHIMSFAVYKIERIAEALISAGRRGVTIAIYLETPRSSKEKISYDTVAALGKGIRSYARIYEWPLDKRLHTETGKHGSLHAKIAIADKKRVFLSSANLTDYAMNLNMEAGLLVESEGIASSLQRHLKELVLDGTFSQLA